MPCYMLRISAVVDICEMLDASRESHASQRAVKCASPGSPAVAWFT